ncbi:uncharacterized protein B0H18DRAFT_1016717 [Fomitopsis serialis]|uniref:uncharacterized protein n=1 Tax=Fomitopsis serialis TaxID=139415 RepID=UPI002008541D|nr:uncharacterized protein B0H18DRAFT_1016717 [Neoantrodia serialis]KAH9922744.1 hypothetical protein B0H18DRAFT_1016717 [Neoantrodia serialis]
MLSRSPPSLVIDAIPPVPPHDTTHIWIFGTLHDSFVAVLRWPSNCIINMRLGHRCIVRLTNSRNPAAP